MGSLFADIPYLGYNAGELETEKVVEIKNQALMQLRREYDNLLYQYKLKLSAATITLTSSSLTLGYWKREEAVIGISTKLIFEYPWKSVLEVLKHELAHQIADEIYGGHEGHDDTFQKACEHIYVETWARSATVELDAKQPSLEELNSSDEDPMQRKFNKLLALSKSSNEREAALALRKAKDLREKYNLNTLRAYNESDIYSLTLHTYKKRLETSYSYITKILANFFGVKAIFSSEYNLERDAEYKTIELVGPIKDLQIAEYVYTYLLNTLDSLWRVYKDTHKNKGKAARNSYRVGVLSGFFQKLKESQATECETHNPSSSIGRFFSFDRKEQKDKPSSSELLENGSTQLVAQNNAVVESVFHQKFPRISNTKSSIGSGDRSSYLAGQSAGKALNISKSISNAKKTFLLS